MSFTDETFLMSRATSGGNTTEFRHDAPLWIAQVMQAVATARGVPRSVIVNELLDEFCKARLRESTLIARMTRGNPDLPDLTPGASE